MNTYINYWISLMRSWWNIITNNPVLSVGIVSVFSTFVIKYLDQLKKIFK